MKNMLLALAVLGSSASTWAELPSQLQGRYALDCTVEQAAELSYIIGDRTLVRLVEGLPTPHVSVPKDLRVVPKDYQALMVQQYDKDQVSFYTFSDHNYAYVESKRMLSFLRPDRKVLLKQCL